MLTFIKATKVTKLSMDKLYVADIRTFLSTFVMLEELEYNPKQQAIAEFIGNNIMIMFIII